MTNFHALKLKAQDGKYRMTDVTDIEGMFRIIESLPSKTPIFDKIKKVCYNQDNFFEREI